MTYQSPPWKNKSIPNFCWGLLGTSTGMADSFCCDLLWVWHGTQCNTWSSICLPMPVQYILVWALNLILVLLGWPWCSVLRQCDLRAWGILNIPWNRTHPCSINKSSHNCQNSLRSLGTYFTCHTQPSISSCIRSCRVGSSLVACCMVSTWIWLKSGVFHG